MKRFLSFVVSLLSLTVNSFSYPDFEKFGDIFLHADVPNISPNVKDWTVAIYINGRNNVDMFAYTDFNRIETVGSSDKVNIVAELGRAQGFMDGETTPEVWSGVRRYYIKKDSNMQKINSLLIEERKNVDMGSWQEAADFLIWAKKNYPAKRYMFIIWDHGWGWIDPVKERKKPIDTRSISHDFTTNNYIKTTELRKIFEKAGRVNLYISMACFMQMAEVITEIKDYANVIVGSEEVIQLPSFNWEDFFESVITKPSMNEEEAGKILTETFKEMYLRPEYFQLLVEGKYGTQLSAIRTRYMDEFLQSVRRLSEIIPNLKDIKSLSRAKIDVLRFEVGEIYNDPDKLISFYADPYHFFELIEKYYTDVNEPNFLEFKKEFLNFKEIVDKKLVIKNVFLNKDRTGKDYSNTHGISMHIPGKEGHIIDYYDTYNHLLFDRITKWSGVIDYLKKID